MKKIYLVLSMMLCGLLFVACSDDDDSGFSSIFSGRQLFINNVKLYSDGTKIDEESISVRFLKSGKVMNDNMGTSWMKNWAEDWVEDVGENATWKFSDNAIMITSRIADMNKVETMALKIVDVDRSTGEFTARYNIENSENKDYLLFHGWIDSDEYD